MPQERRKYPRLKVEPRFKVKARIRKMGDPETHYLRVSTLSMGGLSVEAGKNLPIHLPKGAELELMIYSDHMSLRCVARVAQEIHIDVPNTEGKDARRICVHAGMEIVGIDDKSRKQLATFLELIESTSKKRPKGETAAPPSE